MRWRWGGGHKVLNMSELLSERHSCLGAHKSPVLLQFQCAVALIDVWVVAKSWQGVKACAVDHSHLLACLWTAQSSIILLTKEGRLIVHHTVFMMRMVGVKRVQHFLIWKITICLSKDNNHYFISQGGFLLVFPAGSGAPPLAEYLSCRWNGCTREGGGIMKSCRET